MDRVREFSTEEEGNVMCNIEPIGSNLGYSMNSPAPVLVGRSLRVVIDGMALGVLIWDSLAGVLSIVVFFVVLPGVLVDLLTEFTLMKIKKL
jgi:hypothetical protein